MTEDRVQVGVVPPAEVEDERIEEVERGGSLVVLAILSLVAGAAAGLLGALFRLSLKELDRVRNALIDWSHGHAFLGFVIVLVACSGAIALAAWLVRRFSPSATGSGIPHVESVLKEAVPYAPLHLIPVKFFGGVLAIGAGLALGREGPSVQIGAGVSHLVGKLFRRGWDDCRTLLAAGAGAGLATAFNAPIAGAAFVLEELVRRFDTRIAIAVFGASAAAITVARTMLGYEPDFKVVELGFSDIYTAPLFLVFGLIVGGLGIAYNMMIMTALLRARRLRSVPVEARAAIIGAGVAVLAWFFPTLVGGGDNLTQAALDATAAGGALSLVFLLRFVLGPLSYSTMTPGGLFAPLLVLGAQSGLLFGTLCQSLWPGYAPDPLVFAVTGMAAFFSAVVRAPLTGIILAIELTGSYEQLLPMLSACFLAMLVPTLLRNAPIYDSLREVQGKFQT